ncbi:MAG TPA: TonB family protein [Polyangiaceae bacterium]|nr:TonB family protein [Polyangiaceae bacterium]
MQRLRFIALALLALGIAPAAYAQDAAPAPSEHSLTAPKLVQAAQPVYPPEKLKSGENAQVALVLTLDDTGQVTDVAVAESAGEDFDQAAIEAAKQLRFEPAQRDGKPVPAKIPFRFQFEAQAPEPAPPAAAVVAPAPARAAAPRPAANATPSAADTLDIDVEGERPPREPTQRTVQAEEIQKMPGTNGDALRSLSNMPGVARVGAFDGLLIVRGSSPRDTQIFIDGTNVPIVYHFGGLSSVVPSEMLERIDFYPGNFGPQYGRATGGIVDVGVRSPKKDKLHGLLQVDLVDARLMVEAPINKSTRFMIGGRRSWLDTWLGPALRSSGVGVTAAPVYYDYQAMLEHDLTKNTTVRLFAFGADDRLELTLKSPDSADPAFGGNAGLHSSFWRVQGRVDVRPTSTVRWTTTLGAGHEIWDTAIGDMYISGGNTRFEGRSDLRMKLHPMATAIVGVDAQIDRFDVDYRLPASGFEDDTNSGPVFGKPKVRLTGSGQVLRPAGYAMLELTPVPGLKLLPGVRTDYDQGTKRWTADPRIGVRYDLHAGYPRTTIKGGVGIFHQPPEPYESVKPFGNGGLKSESAQHYSLGFEQELAPPVELSVEGFYKKLDDIVLAAPSVDSSSNGLTYQNLGSGRVYGGELLLRYKTRPGGCFFGWLAYTLSRSDRRDADGEKYYRYDYDQTHILTALGSYKLGRGWQIGARFRYVTGSPYTPNIGGTVDYDAGTYAPVASTARNSKRLPAFHQLDLRVDKTWQFQSWALSTYLDVQNVYNHQNTESIGYNFDYSQTQATHGLPILPIVGIRGEL